MQPSLQSALPPHGMQASPRSAMPPQGPAQPAEQSVTKAARFACRRRVQLAIFVHCWLASTHSSFTSSGTQRSVAISSTLMVIRLITSHSKRSERTSRH
eukprot:6573403-Prymnesium_polylepis.1